MTHILQSEIWQKFEEMEGEETFFCEGEGFFARGVVKKTPVGNYLYAKYGPEILTGVSAENGEVPVDENGADRGDGPSRRADGVDLAVLRRALEALSGVARKKRAFLVRIEPTVEFSEEEMEKLGCRRSKEIDPAHTWVLPLGVSEEEILAGMESNKVRSWRNAKKHGVTVRKTKNAGEIGILTRFLAEVGERAHFRPQDEAHLKNQMEAGFATLYVAEIDEKVPIAAALVYDYQGTRYYAHAGADEKYKKLRAGAVLLVEMILEAKKDGGRWFDFWGVTTVDNPEHPWYGFTQYKKSFGGELVTYTGTYDFVVDKSKYKLYKMVRKANLMVRKVGK